MEHEQITAIVSGLRDERDMLQIQVDTLTAQIKGYQRLCKHPNLYTYYAMGEAGMKCPDCGYQN